MGEFSGCAATNRHKDGKVYWYFHWYFSIVENRRLPGGKTAQHTVLYLGEINDQHQTAWRKTLEVFNEAEQRFTTMSLSRITGDSPDAADRVQVRLGGFEVSRPRTFGNCWLATNFGSNSLWMNSGNSVCRRGEGSELERCCGCRNNLTGEDPVMLRTRYVQVTEIESVFRSLKSELGIRPIYHQLEHRA